MSRKKRARTAGAVCPCGNRCIRSNAVICEACRSDPEKRAKAEWQRSLVVMRDRVDREAEKDTRNLPRRDTFTPLMGESIVNMMMRDDW